MNLINFKEKRYSYIYLRNHESYEIDNIIKAGRTKFLAERNNVYKTGEYYSGKYILVFEVKYEEDVKIEKYLKRYFNNLHRIQNGGTEFFDKSIINEIEDFFIKFGFYYRILSEDEINKKLVEYALRENKNSIKKINNLILKYIEKKRKIKKSIKIIKRFMVKYIKKFRLRKLNKTKNIIKDIIYEIIDKIIDNDNILLENIDNDIDINNVNNITPYPYQKEIINNSLEYFKENDKGYLVLSCGVGKTYTSLWITKELMSKKILIGVPNLLLVKQWYKDIMTIFPDFNKDKILIISGEKDINSIENFLKKNLDECIILTTYASAFKIYQSTKKLNYLFDMKILDECHHLTCDDFSKVNLDESRQFIMSLEIPSYKQLALTATLKEVENDLANAKTISNTDKDYFGNEIERRCLQWAIKENIVCDYVVNVIETQESEISNDIVKLKIDKDEDKKLLLAAYAGIQSILMNQTHHILIYCNKIENTIKIKQYLEYLLENQIFIELRKDIYYENYHSELNSTYLKQTLDNFLKSPKGILSCVYGLGEGWDCKKLDGVVFAENMSSSIRIVQSALRSGRKNSEEPDKINKLIIPIIELNNLLDKEHPDFQKLRQIIWQMGWEDESIIEKIKILNTNNKPRENPGGIGKNPQNSEENDNEIILRGLKQIERPLGVSYCRAKYIIRKNRIKSIAEYYELCEKDNRLYKDPEEQYGDNFKGWIDYLNIERKYYEKEECIRKVNDYLNKYSELNNYILDMSYVCKELCKLDNNFPPNGMWIEYYQTNCLRDIIKLKPKNKIKVLI